MTRGAVFSPPTRMSLWSTSITYWPRTAGFPTPAEQLYDVLGWVSKPEHDWDGSRLCVGGLSAGGSLSAAAARLALEGRWPADRATGPPLPAAGPGHCRKDKPPPVGAKAVLKPWMGRCSTPPTYPLARRTDRLASRPGARTPTRSRGHRACADRQRRVRPVARRGLAVRPEIDAVGSLAEYYEVHGVDHGYNIMSNNVEVTRKGLRAHIRRARSQRHFSVTGISSRKPSRDPPLHTAGLTQI